MKNSFLLGGLAAAFLGLGVVRGQGPSFAPGAPTAPTGVPQLLPAPAPTDNTSSNGNGNSGSNDDTAPLFLKDQPKGDTDPRTPGVSSWLAYPRGPGCCTLVGRNGPIGSEFYVRTGVTVPFGSGPFASGFNPGWDIEGGVRALFFNPACDAAWTADLSITNLHFSPKKTQPVTLFNIPLAVPNGLGGTTTVIQPSVTGTLTELNDTFVNLSGGREYYLWGAPACCTGACCNCGPRWRAGWDLGGRWGTSKVGLDMGANTVGEQHKTGSVSGVFGSVHTDLEYPCGCWTVFVGVRAEYGYIFSDILQGQNDANLQTMNLMLTFGGRF
jgi:hypothetical protein